MKKFLSYVLTFALLFFITAAATVSMAMSGGGGLINPGINNSQQASSSSLFNGILDTFGKHKKFNIKGEVKLTYNETEIPVNLFVDIDISDTNNIKVNGYLNVKYEGNSNVVKFGFYNNTIYLNYNENSVKLETQTIFDLIDEINNLIPSNKENVDNDVSVPNVEGNIPSKDNENTEDSTVNQENEETDILESLMPMLMEALDNMVETNLENGNKRIEITFPDLLDVVLVTDDKNVPKSVIMETKNFKGYKLFANIDIEFNDNIFIYNPETKQNALNYFDLGVYEDVVKNLLNLKTFNSQMNLKVNNKTISFDALFDLEKNDYRLTLLNNDFGYVDSLDIIYKNNNAYLSVNNINILFNEDLINEGISLVNKFVDLENVNVNLVLNKLNSLINSVNIQEMDIETALALLVCVKDFVVDSNELSFVVDTSVFGLDIGTISFGLKYQNNEIQEIYLKNLIVDGNFVDLSFTTEETEEQVTVENIEKYLNIYDLINKNKLYFNSDAFSLDFDLLFKNNDDNFELDSSVQFDLGSEYVFTNLKFNVNGIIVPVEIEYVDSWAYVKYNNIKLKMSKGQVKELINNFNVGLNQIEYQDILNKINFNLTEGDLISALYSLKGVEINGNQLQVEIDLNKFGFDLDSSLIVILEDSVVKEIIVNVNYNENYLRVDAKVLSNYVTEKVINTEEYLNVKELIKNVSLLVSSNILNVSINADLFDGNHNFVSGFDLGFSKLFENDHLLLNVFAGLIYDNLEFNLNGIYQDSTTFVEFGGLKLMLETDRLNETVSRILSVINENPELLNKLVWEIEKFLNVGDLAEVKDVVLLKAKQALIIDKKELINLVFALLSKIEIDASGIKLKLNGNVFGYEGIIDLEILFENNNISKIIINDLKLDNYYLNIDLSVNTSKQEMQTISKEEKEEYINIAELSEVVEAAYNIIKTKSITGIATVKFNYENKLVLLNVNYGFKLDKNNKLVVYLSTNLLGKDINIYFANDTIFIDVQGLKTKIQINEIPELINWLNSEFNLNINLNKIDTSIVESKMKDITFILGAIANIDVSTILEKVVFNENSMEIILDENSSIFINYNILLEQVVVHKNGKYFELNIEPKAFEFNDINFNEFVSYESLIDIFNSVINTLNTESNLNFDLSLNINNQNISASVQVDKNYNIQVTLANNTFGTVESLIITYIDNEIYLRVNNIYVLVSNELMADMPTYLAEIINMFKLEDKIHNIYDFALEKKNSIQKFNPLAILDYLENINLTTTGVSVTLDSKELNFGNEIVISLTHNKQTITNVSIGGLNVNNNSINLSVSVKETQNNICVEDSKKYNDIYKTILNNIDYFSGGKLDFSIDAAVIINNEQISVNGNVKFNISENYIGLNLFVGYKTGYKLNVEIVEGEIYLTINNVKVKVSQEQLMDIVGSLDLTVIYELIEKVYSSAKESIEKVSYKDIALKVINLVENVTLDSNQISVIVNGIEIGLNNNVKAGLILENNILKSVNLSEIKKENIGVSGEIIINSNVVTKNSVIKEEYIDVVNFINNVCDLLNAKQGEICLDANVDVYNKNCVLDLDFEGSLDKEYFDLILNLGGGYDLFVNLTMINGELYAKVNDIFVKADIKTILGLILSQNLNKSDIDLSLLENVESITNIKDYISNFDLLDLCDIKNIKANNEQIEIIIDKTVMGGLNDLVINIKLNNNTPTSITINNLFIDSNVNVNSLTLSFEEKEIQEKELNTEIYLDIEDIVNKASELPYLNDLNAILGVDFYTLNNGNYTHELGLGFDYKKHNENGELWSLMFSILNGENKAEMSAVYENQKIFTNYNGLKLMLETNEISNIVNTILSMVGVENNYNNIVKRVVTFLEGNGLINALDGIKLPSVEMPDLNTLMGAALFTIENLIVTSNNLIIDIDGNMFGYDGTISVKVDFENNNISKITITKLKVENIYVDITLTLSLEEQSIQTVPESEQEYYINVAKLTEAVNALYNTITQDYVTGCVTLTTDIFGEDVSLNIHYGIGNNNGTFEVYIETEYKGITVKLIYKNGAIYFDIQGMKVQIQLNNISELISWVENEFGIDIDEQKVNDAITEVKDSMPSTIEEIVEFMANVDLAIINKVEFNEVIIKSFINSKISKTMLVELANGMTLSFGYNEKVQDVVVVSENLNVSATIHEEPEFTESYDPNLNTSNYTSYKDLTKLITLLKQTISNNNNFDVGLDILTNKGEVSLNALLDINKLEAKLDIFKNTFGYIDSLEVVYKDGQAYLRVNDLYILISQELINDTPDLLDNLFINLGMQTSVNEILEELKSQADEISNINFVDYLKYIQNVEISSTRFKILINANMFGLGDYIVEIVIIHDGNEIRFININDLNINDMSIDLTLTVSHTEENVNVNNPEQYIDIYNVVKENYEFFKTGELDLDVNVELDSELDLVVNGNIKLDLNNKEFGLRLNITGDYNLTLELDYYNDTAYVVINGIKVQTTLDKVQELLKEFGLEFNTEEITSMLNNTPEIDVTINEIWNAIEKLMLTSNGLELNFNLNSFDIDSILDLVVNIENSLVKELLLNNFNINGNIINANIILNNNSIERNEINEEEYLDITNTILNAKDLVNKNIINLFADITLFDSDLNEEFKLNLDLSKIFENDNLTASAFINLIYNNKEFDIDTVYQNNIWFANLNGLKLFLEKDRLEETIQTILSVAKTDVHSYDDIINKIINLLEGESLYNILQDMNINVAFDASGLDYETIIKEVLKNIEISSTEIKLNIDGNIFGYDSLINVLIKLENNNITAINIDKLKLGDKFVDVSIKISGERKEIENISSGDKETYVNLAEFAKVAKATLKTFESKTISGFFTLGFTFAGERNLLNVNYGICFDKDKGYEGYIQTNFKGLDVNIYFIDNKIYLDIIGLKIHLSFEDMNGLVNWLTKFGVELDFDFTSIEKAINGETQLMPEMDISKLLDTVFGLDLSLINKAIFNENSLEAIFNGGLNIFVNYTDVVNQVIFQDGDIYVELNCTDFNNFALDINKEEFNSYLIVTDMVDAALQLLKKKQVSMDAETLVYENNILADRVDIDLDINTLNTLNVYADIIVNNDKNTNINFAYQDDYIFANYKNLKLSLSQKSLKELLVIVLEALGVDAKTIGFLGNVAEDMNLDTDNLKEIMPNLDFGNPLNMLKLVKSINIVDGEFIIIVDGAGLTGVESSDDMTLKVKALDGDISTIKLGNVYSNGEKQRFDLNINFTDYAGVKQITDKSSYVDVSGSAGILKAFVNTSYLTDYSIKGTITVIAKVIGINIDMDIPVEARIKLVDGKPVTYIVMDVPVIGSNVPGFTGINVNNDVPYEFGDTSVDSRRLEIMYKDDFVYFYRKDVVNQTVFADRVYEKALKLAGSEMSSDLVNYLLSYGLGFSDAIMGEIDKAIIKATDRADNPLDVSNILKGFSHTDNTDLYSILINLAEIANNELLGDALINIYTVNNASTNNKDYIGKLAFDINMPLASVCEINLETNDLTLNNIGQTVDVSNVDSYVNNYQFKENQQYEKSGGNWEFAGEKQYTIKFIDSKGNTVNDIVAPVDTAITLPSLSTIVETKADGEYTYTFAGWYLSEDFKESSKVSYSTMPRGNRTLYAKWNESVKYNRNVTLNSMGGEQDSVITGLEGSRFILPTLENKIVVDGQTKITYGFTGWFKNESCTESATVNEIPSEDITLFAGWEEISRYVAYNLKVIDNGTEVFNEYIGEGLDIELSGFTMDSFTKFYLTQDYANEYTIGKMPSNDLTLYVRNRYALNIVSAYGTVYDTTDYYYQGEVYSLPGQSNYVVDDGNTQVTYTFNGWEGKTSVMPNSNLRVVASWSSVTKHYYEVTFKLGYNGNAAYYKYAKLYRNGVEIGSNEVKVKVLEGSLNLNEYSADWKYSTGSGWFKVNWYYNFQGFSTSKNGSAVSSVNITGNTTIYGLWSSLKS